MVGKGCGCTFARTDGDHCGRCDCCRNMNMPFRPKPSDRGLFVKRKDKSGKNEDKKGGKKK